MRVLARRAEPNPDLQWAAGDLATGEGLAEALRGVHSVVHAATLSPIARRGSIRPTDFFTTPSEVDVEGARRLLEASERAGVAHFLHVSIVGLEDSALP